MHKNISSTIPVKIYGDVEQYTPTLSKARCRTFYKYGNRNGSYISDEFAEKLISTMPYAPVKGIYSDGDYEDHGESNDEGRIYGVIPKDMNFAWEDHLDEDGIVRQYACADVLLYTAIYKEANEIVGKSQSMELYRPSIKGEYREIDGIPYFYYTDACFLGMQVLGDDTTPCFEGAAFFSLYNQMIKEIENYKEQNNKDIEGGNEDMPKISFNTPTAVNYNSVWAELNKNYTEENNWLVDYVILDMDDEFVTYQELANNACKKRKYTLSEGKVEFAEDEEEVADYRALNEQLTKATADMSAANETISEINEKIEENAEKISEYEAQITTLNTEKGTLEETIRNNENELESLREFKKEQEIAEKKAVVATYSEKLEEEVLNNYLENLADYSLIDLEKSLAYDLVKSTPAIFSASEGQGYVPKEDTLDGLAAVLSAYKKNGGK